MPDDRPVRVRRRSNMLRAVNREVKTLPVRAQESATAELARQMAREVDAGDRAAAAPLMRALEQLRKLAVPPAGARHAPDVEETEPDELDELARARADRLANAAGVVRSLGADQRRRGGRASS